MKIWIAAFLVPLAACATVPPAPLPTSPVPLPPTEVQILAINDFHGNLEPPKLSIEAGTPEASLRVPAGGIAHLATAATSLPRLSIARLRQAELSADFDER